ncbi:trypsin-like peptidase domain-containing protein [bacterium]|nr:trypsin-like peptidase domain-containing protein [bacterium]
MRLFFTLITLGFISSNLVAQEVEVGKKYFYDSEWRLTTVDDHAMYYRVYDSFNGTGWPVRDYYAPGCLQFQGTVTFPNAQKADCELENCTGPTRYYFKNGNISAEGTLVNGKRFGNWTFYCMSGDVQSTGYYSKKGEMTSYQPFVVCNNNGIQDECDFVVKNEESDSWMGNGSGILFNSLGFVLTNQHVVDGASSVSVVIGNAGQQVEYEAGVVGVDADIDLALLKITDVAFGGVDAPPFSFQTRASVGEEIFALGYPMALSGLGAEMKYTNGSVSANSGFNGDMKTMQISVPIQGGNSGGPLFNAQGELIGITNAKIRSDVADNVSYAIKSIFVEAFLGSMPYEVSLPNGVAETENRVDVIEALRPYTCLVLVK